MQTKITKTIRVSIDVKQHLDEMKGSVSASEFIETMLSYFERNGVDPRTSINGKFKTLELQGIERIIKIVSVSAILSCRPFFILIFLPYIKMNHYGFSRKSIWKNLETFP